MVAGMRRGRDALAGDTCGCSSTPTALGPEPGPLGPTQAPWEAGCSSVPCFAWFLLGSGGPWKVYSLLLGYTPGQTHGRDVTLFDPSQSSGSRDGGPSSSHTCTLRGGARLARSFLDLNAAASPWDSNPICLWELQDMTKYGRKV